MGYCTRHELSVLKGDQTLIEQLISENEEARFAVDANGDTRGGTKWYDHQEHLKAFSEKHPEALFLLDGEGDDSADIWIEYYQGGKMQVCKGKIVFPDFNPVLLK